MADDAIIETVDAFSTDAYANATATDAAAATDAATDAAPLAAAMVTATVTNAAAPAPSSRPKGHVSLPYFAGTTEPLICAHRRAGVTCLRPWLAAGKPRPPKR